MKAEIVLEIHKGENERRALISNGFQEWLRAGPYGCYGDAIPASSGDLERDGYLIDFGSADCIQALHDLHNRLDQFSVNIFIKFLNP